MFYVVIDYNNGQIHVALQDIDNDRIKNNCSVLVMKNFFYIFLLAECGLLSLRMLKKTLLEAAKAGASEIQRFFNNEFKISYKEGINNPVTEADHAADKAI